MSEALVRLQKEISGLPRKENLVSVVVYGTAVSGDLANDLDIVVVVKNADPSLTDLFNLLGRYSKNLDFNVYTEREISEGISYFTREFKLEYLAKGACLYGRNVLADEYRKVDVLRYRQSILIRSIEHLQMVRQRFYNPFLDEGKKAAFLRKYFWRIAKNLLLFEGVGDHATVNLMTEHEILAGLVRVRILPDVPSIGPDLDLSGWFRLFGPLGEGVGRCKAQLEAGAGASQGGYLHYLNGSYVPEEKFLVSPRDLGFSRGYGVFDYLRTYGGRPFKLEEHLARFLRSAEAIGLKHDYTLEQLIRIVKETLAKNDDGEEKQLRIMMSGGPSSSMRQVGAPTFMVMVDRFKPKDPKIYQGVKLDPVKFHRYKPESKNTNYIEGIMQQTKSDGSYEPLYYGDDQVYETSNSNVFAVKGGQIYTPRKSVFCGGTRGVLVHDLKDELHIVEKDFDLEFLIHADEVFIASSGKEIVPVVQIGEHRIGNGKAGEVTELVRRKFKDYVNSGKW